MSAHVLCNRSFLTPPNLLQGQLQAVFYTHGSVCLEKPESLQVQLDKEGDARAQREQEQPDFQTCGSCLSVLLFALPQRQDRRTKCGFCGVCVMYLQFKSVLTLSRDAVSLHVGKQNMGKNGGENAPTGFDMFGPC